MAIIEKGQGVNVGETEIPDNQVALKISSTDAKDYITINTTDGSEKITLTNATETIGAISTAITGTFTATQGSDVINAGSSTAFLTELHVGSAIKIPSDVAAGFEIFTVDGITSDTILSLDSNYLGSTRATSGGAFTDGGELFAVKTGDSKSLFSVNETGAIGCGSAAADNSASNNIAIGDSDALNTVTTGTKNLILGTATDNWKLTTGHSNVFAGYRAGEDCVATNSAVIIGFQTGCVGSIGNNATLVGANAGLESVGANVTAIGFDALRGSTGADNTSLGYQAGNAVTSGAQNISIGSGSDCAAAVNNQIAIGYGSVTDDVNKMRLGNATLATADIKVDWTVDSDSRIKENIQDADAGLDFINALRPVNFTRKHPAEWPEEIREKIYKQGSSSIDADGNEVFSSTPQFDVDTQQPIKDEFDDTRRVDGLIAQEVKAAIQSTGVTYAGLSEAKNGKMGVQYATLVVPLIAAVKELSSQNESLAARIATLELGG